MAAKCVAIYLSLQFICQAEEEGRFFFCEKSKNADKRLLDTRIYIRMKETERLRRRQRLPERELIQ